MAATSVAAQPPTQCSARLALHLGPVVTATKNPCTQAPSEFACGGFDFNAATTVNFNGLLGTGYSAYVVVLELDPDAGLSGAKFSTRSDPDILVNNWVSCGGGTAVPDPGNGGWTISVDFDPLTECQQTTDPTDPDSKNGFAVLGRFYVYAYADGTVQFGGHPSLENIWPDLEEWSVTDCAGTTHILDSAGAFGWLGFGTTAGWAPCMPDDVGACVLRNPIPVQKTTWGGVKKLR